MSVNHALYLLFRRLKCHGKEEACRTENRTGQESQLIAMRNIKYASGYHWSNSASDLPKEYNCAKVRTMGHGAKQLGYQWRQHGIKAAMSKAIYHGEQV